MSDGPLTEGLEKKLAALSETGEFRDGAMRLAPSGTPAAMAAILHAIDTTILPRVVTFAVGDNSVSLNVGGRRLRSCLSTSQELDPPKKLLGQLLSSDTSDAVREVGDLLQKLVASEGTLTLVRSAGLSPSDQTEGGIGMNALAEHWDIDPNAKPPSKFELFIGLLGSSFLASVEIVDGSAINPQGNGDIVSEIETKAMADLTELEQQLNKGKSSTTGRQLAVLEGLLPDDALIALVSLGETKAVVAAEAGAFAAIAAAWDRS